MRTSIFGSLLLLFLSASLQAQFHNLALPTASPEVSEEQSLGITKIALHYHSPMARGRKVWEDGRTIPQKGEPIAWRAGANMNTTISFSTDVYIEGEALAAGTYGLHIIPDGHQHRVLFAHANQLWGSYYLDVEKDISLEVSVQDTTCAYSEKLDYEFDHINDSTLVLGLEWADRRIPIEIKVDLVKTVMTSLRSELRGEDTYRWEAWNDAAQFCYDHQQHLEEGLSWVDHSINGGYGGYGANPNLYNYSTKLYILGALNRGKDQKALLKEALKLSGDRNAKLTFASALLRNGLYAEASQYLDAAQKELSDDWVVKLDRGVAYYHTGNSKKALKLMKELEKEAPDFFQNRLKQVIAEMEAGSYQYPKAPHRS